MKKPRLIVVGNGMAGMRTVEELLKTVLDLSKLESGGTAETGTRQV